MIFCRDNKPTKKYNLLLKAFAMNINKPKVTVLMPVYNGEKYLREAIDSILNQTFSDFEFLIINDGSTDKSVEIINSYNDSRICLIHNTDNLGLINSLNKGLELADGEYIARMDSDDISLPKRLERQVNVMDENLDVGICGTWFDFINLDYKVRHPIESPVIKVHLLINTAFGHPTVMLRKKILKESQWFYDKNYKHAEDYDFFSRLSDNTECYNVPEVLLKYRDHPEQISQLFWKEQSVVVDRIRINRIIKLGLDTSYEERKVHLDLIKANITKNIEIKKVDNWIEKLIGFNSKKRIYDQELLAEKFIILRKNFIEQNKIDSSSKNLLDSIFSFCKKRIKD